MILVFLKFTYKYLTSVQYRHFLFKPVFVKVSLMYVDLDIPSNLTIK